MAEESKDQSTMDVVPDSAEESADEYQVQFDDTDESFQSGSLSTSAAIIAFKTILKANERADDVAVKIKEQCLYR